MDPRRDRVFRSIGQRLGDSSGESATTMAGYVAELIASASGVGLYYDRDRSLIFQDAAATTPAADGDPVGYWEDLSGNGHHVTQSANLPTLRAGGVEWNGGSNIGLQLASVYAGIVEGTLFADIEPYSVGESNVGTLFSKQNEMEIRFGGATGTVRCIVQYSTVIGDVTTASAVLLNERQSWAFRFSAASPTPQILINAEVVAQNISTSASGTRTSNANPWRVGELSPPGVVCWHGLVKRLVFVGRRLTDEEIGTLQVLSGL